MDPRDLAFAGAAEQARMLAAGSITAPELLELYLDRIARLDRELRSYRVVLADTARQEAGIAQDRLNAGERLPLLGVPIAIKDDVDVAGEVTTYGTAAHGPAPTQDAEVVRRLREAGAVILGKTTVPEMMIWSFTETVTFGATRNPWNTDYTPGGSSGGSCAAVAAGLAPMALGSDGMGSIRIPSTWCGLFGLKPERDRVSLAPHDDAWNGLSVNGPIARTVEDAALFLDVTTTPAPGDSFVGAAAREPDRLRIALSTKVPPPLMARVGNAQRAAVDEAGALLRELGHYVIVRDPGYPPKFILWYWAPVYANILTVEVLQPLAAVLKLDGLSDFLANENGLFIVIQVTVVLAGVLVALGMETYAKIQKVCFYIGIAALGLLFLIMLFGSRSGFQSAFNEEAANLFGASGDTYNRTLELAGGSQVVPDLGFTPFLGPTLLLVPFLAFWILYPNWGATLYGEVRGASDFRRVLVGMMQGLWITIAIAVAFVLLAAKFFGWQFFNAANLGYWNTVYATGEAAIPIWPFPPLLASFYFHSPILSTIIVLAFGAWFLGWAGTLFLSSTRVIFAAAFDRILPERMADVSEHRHVPVWALILMLVPSLVVGALYAYTDNFATYILDAVLVITVTFFGTAIAAMILPYRKRHLYENSPIARYKLAGIPLISITGFVTAVFLGYNLWKWFQDDLYAVNNRESLVFLGSMYLLALLIYVVARIYRRRQGIDLRAVHEEIPVE